MTFCIYKLISNKNEKILHCKGPKFQAWWIQQAAYILQAYISRVKLWAQAIEPEIVDWAEDKKKRDAKKLDWS